MANADAYRAPTGKNYAKSRIDARGRNRLSGHIKLLADPAYGKLLAAEPYLRRAIPPLIIIFLLALALARSMSLLSWRDDTERTARATLVHGSNPCGERYRQSHEWRPKTERG